MNAETDPGDMKNRLAELAGDATGDLDEWLRELIARKLRAATERWIDRHAVYGNGMENAPPREPLFFADGRPVNPE